MILALLACTDPAPLPAGTAAETGSIPDSPADTALDTAPPDFAVPEHPYLLSFHSCPTDEETCGNPQNHTVQLAGSADGVSWEVLDWFAPYPGSVPDVLVRDGILYIYALPQIRRIDLATFAVLPDEGLTFLTEEELFHADPSVILDEDGRIVMFFLEGSATGDPASCPEGPPCTLRILSATEQEGSLGTVFSVDEGARLAVEVTEESPARLSDPDIFVGASGYVLLVSQGQNVRAYGAEALQGSYEALGKDNLTPNTGGVPAGGYVDGQHWLYVTVDGDDETARIHHTATADLTQELPADALSPISLSPVPDDAALIASPGFFAVPHSSR